MLDLIVTDGRLIIRFSLDGIRRHALARFSWHQGTSAIPLSLIPVGPLL